MIKFILLFLFLFTIKCQVEGIDISFWQQSIDFKLVKKAGYKLFWLGCGDVDPWFAEAQELDRLLTNHGMPHTFYITGGGHEWKNWRHYLDTFAPLLFK